jgi:hypothetical protein
LKEERKGDLNTVQNALKSNSKTFNVKT